MLLRRAAPGPARRAGRRGPCECPRSWVAGRQARRRFGTPEIYTHTQRRTETVTFAGMDVVGGRGEGAGRERVCGRATVHRSFPRGSPHPCSSAPSCLRSFVPTPRLDGGARASVVTELDAGPGSWCWPRRHGLHQQTRDRRPAQRARVVASTTLRRDGVFLARTRRGGPARQAGPSAARGGRAPRRHAGGAAHVRATPLGGQRLDAAGRERARVRARRARRRAGGPRAPSSWTTLRTSGSRASTGSSRRRASWPTRPGRSCASSSRARRARRSPTSARRRARRRTHRGRRPRGAQELRVAVATTRVTRTTRGNPFMQQRAGRHLERRGLQTYTSATPGWQGQYFTRASGGGPARRSACRGLPLSECTPSSGPSSRRANGAAPAAEQAGSARRRRNGRAVRDAGRTQVGTPRL